MTRAEVRPMVEQRTTRFMRGIAGMQTMQNEEHGS